MQVLSNNTPADVSTTTGIAGVAFEPAPAVVRQPSSATFDPKVHLCYEKPSKTYTFEDLGLDAKGITPTAITEAFPLFTKEAIIELRKDCLSTKVLDDFTYSSKLAALQAREFHPSVAPFTCATFSSRAFVDACSDAAGIELVPIMPLEYGNTNFQVGPGGKAAVRQLSDEPSSPYPPVEGQIVEDSDHVVGWHHDSYPFVAVTMLSDVRNMIGGETAIEKGNGVIAKIRGPDMGWTVVMQGRYVKHLACKAYNAPERITMVTSFRAKDSSVPDESVLTTIRPITKKNRVNAQWSIYRLRLVAERMQKLANEIEAASKDDILAEKDVCNKKSMQEFVDAQTKYLQHGINEMMG